VPLSVAGVSADPTLSFLTGAAAGVTQHAQIYSGSCRVVRKKESTFEGYNVAQLGFYVPQAGPFRPSHLLSAWAEATPAWLSIAGDRSTQSGTYGVSQVRAELVNDGRGSGMVWPYLWMVVSYGAPMEVRYRVTVTQPLENA
jgi:hypothetical protein